MVHLFQQAGWVAWPLGIASVVALAVILERLVVLGRLKQAEDQAMVMLQIALERHDDAVFQDPRIQPAPITRVAAVLAQHRGADRDDLREIAAAQISLQRLRMRRYLGVLAAIASTAPFIGLFGTVLGVMKAFQGMSRTGLNGESMAAGISEALSATAVGLLVAIPAVIAYNLLTGRTTAMLATLRSHTARLLPMISPEPARREA
jgi:biopolymer transport protein ExbB